MGVGVAVAPGVPDVFFPAGAALGWVAGEVAGFAGLVADVCPLGTFLSSVPCVDVCDCKMLLVESAVKKMRARPRIRKVICCITPSNLRIYDRICDATSYALGAVVGTGGPYPRSWELRPAGDERGKPHR